MPTLRVTYLLSATFNDIFIVATVCIKDFKNDHLAKRQRHRSQQVDADTEFTWLAQLLRPDNRKVVCLAILISPQHLITQKRCFAEAKLA